ncbi:MAG: phosphate signaling complex protein PhoU [Acidobacteria bacterium]|nr:phosphate signaling complex protein PhoU [Acidobacteriota bacterium]
MPEQRWTFHQELDEIRDEIVQLGALVREFIPRGTEVLLTGDMGGALDLIEADDELDALTLRIEENCYNVLARQQPMASDLRSIVTAVWLTGELERSGDLMVNVAKAARRIYGATLDPRLCGLIERMSEEAARLVSLSLDAYVERNASLGAALADIDDALDALHGDYIEAIFDAHSSSDLGLQPAVQLALVGRYYERIGDHAVNIGQRVQYMVTGWLPEQTGAARLRAREKFLTDGAQAPESGSAEGP